MKLGNIILIIFFVLFFTGIIVFSVIGLNRVLIQYKEYKSFCDSKPSFCYCSFIEGCTFKLQYSTLNGYSNDTLEFCKLADKLKDKQGLFEAGCPEVLL
jgi:hypothetical protein